MGASVEGSGYRLEDLRLLRFPADPVGDLTPLGRNVLLPGLRSPGRKVDRLVKVGFGEGLGFPREGLPQDDPLAARGEELHQNVQGIPSGLLKSPESVQDQSLGSLH